MSAIVYKTFIYEVGEGIATVRLNEPDKLNALTFQTCEPHARERRDHGGKDNPSQEPR